MQFLKEPGGVNVTLMLLLSGTSAGIQSMVDFVD